MSQTSRSLRPWIWPVKPEQYDRTPQLRTEEIELLTDNLRCLKKGIHACEVLARCDLPRLLRPLEDVCSHTRLHEKYRPGLKVLMLREMAARARSFWGWSEEEWIETTKNTGHAKHTVAVFAYLLCGSTPCISSAGGIFCFMVLPVECLARSALQRCPTRSETCFCNGVTGPGWPAFMYREFSAKSL